MAKAEHFDSGFLHLDDAGEELFVSVTPGFEHGPGIERDGITSPRMIDPHSVPRVFNTPTPRIPTLDPFLQRAGTWTMYHHLKQFLAQRGADWRVIGIQSNGDLTMNPWHIAYIGQSHLQDQDGTLCALLSHDPKEPVLSRIYRCLVKWTDTVIQIRPQRYECLNLRIEEARGQRYALKINDPDVADRYDAWLRPLSEYNTDTKNIAPLVEFVLSGKPIVEDGIELSLTNAIDRFQDVRHVFSLPSVPATGYYREQDVKEIYFGEHKLFHELNVRRAALVCPVIIDLKPNDHVNVEWEVLVKKLTTGRPHFKPSNESPTRRGQFRRYLDQRDRGSVEIFFPHNVYPFGVLGVQNPQPGSPPPSGLVCFSSGGLSGRVGTTLEGVARIMYDFFGCVDAMVLDEGYDVFFVANPTLDKDCYRYTNDQMLRKVLSFTKDRVDEDVEESTKQSGGCPHPGGMRDWPLNRDLLAEVEEDYRRQGRAEYADVLLVRPQRSQMRSVLIFAVRQPKDG